MRRIYAGWAVFMLGIVGFILDERYKPNPAVEAFISGGTGEVQPKQHRIGISTTAYDLVHAASWALLVAGVLLMAAGLVWYSASLRRTG